MARGTVGLRTPGEREGRVFRMGGAVLEEEVAPKTDSQVA